jgi:hypothetical protein
MGFWKSAFTVFQDVTSLGGTYRLRENTEKFQRLKAIYDRLCQHISDCNSEIAVLLGRLHRQAAVSQRRLQKIEKILNPLGYKGDLATGSSLAFGKNTSIPTVGGPIKHSTTKDSLGTYASTVVGAGAGTAVAAGTWGAVQILAHASTGTAMAGLHGAAAANAGWAWFGGGSLAAGGGGMALGDLVLPGIGTAVAVAVSATMSHSEANKLGKYCEELEVANQKNDAALSLAKSNLFSLEQIEIKLLNEDQILSDALRHARRKLFRFGYFSHLWRLLTYWFRGYYYAKDEFVYVDDLGMATLRFVNSFKK